MLYDTLNHQIDTAMSSSEDEDLRLAIALSMRDKDKHEVINLDSDEDEAVSEASRIRRHQPAPTSNLSFLGIDRKKMEQERLARKRKASVSPPPARKIQKTDDSFVSCTKATQPVIKTELRPSATANTPKGPLMFPKGIVKKTWAFGHPRTADDIKIEEVLQSNDLSLAVLSSFQWDVAWLLAKVNTNSMDEHLRQDTRI